MEICSWSHFKWCTEGLQYDGFVNDLNYTSEPLLCMADVDQDLCYVLSGAKQFDLKNKMKLSFQMHFGYSSSFTVKSFSSLGYSAIALLIYEGKQRYKTGEESHLCFH